MTRISGWMAAVTLGVACLMTGAGTGLAQPPQPPQETKKVSEAELAAGLESHVKALAAADEFSGAVLLAKDGKPVFQQAYGLAEMAFQVPNRTDTKFNLGSIPKMFTRVAIDQLAEQGKLSLDDTIAKHLPAYPNQEVAAKVTIRQLIDHSSGLGDIFNDLYREANKDRFREPRDYFELFANEPLLFEPGTGEEYSNAGYVVLGAIVEAASGQNYFEYVQQHVFQPAGMTNTGSWELDTPVPNRAVGYTKRNPTSNGERRNVLFWQLFKGSPAGGAYSTVDDLLKFDRALRAGTFFKNPRPIAGNLAIAGGFAGCSALLEQFPGGYTIIVLSNYDPPGAFKVSGKVREMLGLKEAQQVVRRGGR